MPKLDGVDTSNNQGAGVVNLKGELQQAGVQGWWHKATEGANFRDRYWPTVRAESRAFRYRGPYHWLSPSSSVVAQFDNFVGYVGDLEQGECIQLDVEDPAGLSDNKVFEAVDRWMERYAGRILVYTGRFYMPYKPKPGGPVENYLIDRLMARYGEDLKWWLPWYATTYPGNRIPMTPVMWQWAGGGAGVVTSVGRIDSNEEILKDELEKLCGYGNKVDPPPPPPPPPPPDTKDDEMSYFRYTPEGYVAEINMGYKTWVTGDYFYGVVQGQLQGSGVTSPVGIYATPAPLDKIQAIPDNPATTPPAAVVDINAIAQAVREKLRSDPLK